MRSVSSPVNSTPVGPAPMTWVARDFFHRCFAVGGGAHHNDREAVFLLGYVRHDNRQSAGEDSATRFKPLYSREQ